MKKIIFCLSCLILFLTSCSENSLDFGEQKALASSQQNYSTLLIDLKGEVNYPGIYEVESGIYLYDLVKRAGGFTAYADVDSINLVQSFVSNQMVIIPTTKTLTTETSNDKNSLININRASLEELTHLPGVGTGKASKIIAYRNEYGSFNSIEDIMQVSGIGNETFNQFKDQICV